VGQQANRLFTSMLHASYQKHAKHILKYHLLTAKPPSLPKQWTVCTKQDLRREHSILQYVTFMLDVYRVYHCVGHCVKIGSCSYQT